MGRSKIKYRDLLKRYIQHVVECEGTDFLSVIERMRSEREVDFTPEEWAELEKLAKEK